MRSWSIGAVIFGCVIGVSSAFAEADVRKVEVNTATSSVGWTGRKVTGSHNGIVALKSGIVEMRGGSIVGGQFEIDMGTIKVLDITDPKDNAKLANHLKSEDFFAVGKFPSATFRITKAEKLGSDADTYQLTGMLTVVGVSQELSFPARISINGDVATATATVNVDRTKYNVRYGSGKFFENLGDKLIYDEFTIDLKLDGVVKPVA